MPKIESENKFLTSIKDYNSVLICQIYPSAIPEHSFTISTLISSLKKIGINFKGMPKIESENRFLTSSRTVTLYLFAKITHLQSQDTHSQASLKKIGLKMLPAESENDALMDGRTLKRNFLNGGYNIIPRTF